MKFAKVIGQAVTNRKENVDGLNLLLVRFLESGLEDSARIAVCADTVKSRSGDIVLICSSSSARLTEKTQDTCIDHAIVGIVDSISGNKQVLYRKEK